MPAQASLVALGKILSVLPASARAAAQSMTIYAPPSGLGPAVQATLQTLREAAQEHRKIQMTYRDASEQTTQRTVRPLGCFYLGKVWTGRWPTICALQLLLGPEVSWTVKRRGCAVPGVYFFWPAPLNRADHAP